MSGDLTVPVSTHLTTSCSVSERYLSIPEQLLTLTQNSNTAAEYTLPFRTLDAQTEWIEDTLKLLYRRGLNQAFQTEMACYNTLRRN